MIHVVLKAHPFVCYYLNPLHRLAEVLEVKEEYILLESNFRTNSDQLKYQEEQIDINDTSVMQYLKSLGYDIGFQWKGEKDNDVNKLLDYFIHNLKIINSIFLLK